MYHLHRRACLPEPIQGAPTMKTTDMTAAIFPRARTQNELFRAFAELEQQQRQLDAWKRDLELEAVAILGRHQIGDSAPTKYTKIGDRFRVTRITARYYAGTSGYDASPYILIDYHGPILKKDGKEHARAGEAIFTRHEQPPQTEPAATLAPCSHIDSAGNCSRITRRIGTAVIEQKRGNIGK